MVIIILIVLGLCLGSFINALVWRIHEQSKSKTKQNNKAYSILSGRSMCPNCKHQLETKDLIPVFSWIALKGQCRYCGRKIGLQYPLVELFTAAMIIMSYIYWPSAFSGFGLVEFCLWVIFLVGFIALSIYDIRWTILPNRIIYPLIGLAIVQLLIGLIFFKTGTTAIFSAIFGILFSGGLFYALYTFSDGRWIGGGDVKLGFLIGIIIGGPINSILVLIIASFLGTFYSVPLLVSGKVTRSSKIPFGPFLIIAAVIMELFGITIVNFYKHLFL